MRVNVKHSFYVGDVLLNLGEVVVAPGSQLIDWSLERLETEFDLSVVCYRGEEMTDLHPRPDLRLGAGDKLLVLALLETLYQLNDLAAG